MEAQTFFIVRVDLQFPNGDVTTFRNDITDTVEYLGGMAALREHEENLIEGYFHHLQETYPDTTGVGGDIEIQTK